MSKTFRKSVPINQRLGLANRMLQQNPDNIPVIIESLTNDIKMNSNKFLIPRNISLGAFLLDLRNHTNLNYEQTVYLYCGNNNILVPTNKPFGYVYDQYKDADGFLYMAIDLENTLNLSHIKTYSMAVLDMVLLLSEKTTSFLKLDF